MTSLAATLRQRLADVAEPGRAAGMQAYMKSAMPYLGVLAFFITFFVMGVWHGSTAVFVIYGLLMGAGVSINKLWQIYMTKRFGKKGYKAFGERKLYQYACRGADRPNEKPAQSQGNAPMWLKSSRKANTR